MISQRSGNESTLVKITLTCLLGTTTRHCDPNQQRQNQTNYCVPSIQNIESLVLAFNTECFTVYFMKYNIITCFDFFEIMHVN